MKAWKQKRFEKILAAHAGLLSAPSDLLADQPPSWLCLLLGLRYRKMFDTVADKVCLRGIRWRSRLHPVIKPLLPKFMDHKQVIENREALRSGRQTSEADPGIALPGKPVVWMANHGFKDDTAATLVAAYRQCYILFGSIPQFYNTMDGVCAALNGAVMVNRKSQASSHTAVVRSVQLLRMGMDLMMFPEGVWNKTPNQIILPLWSGIYRICRESGAKVVPVVHYLDPIEKDPLIHTVIDDPVDITGMSEQEALSYLRDIMAGWYYLLMERYGQTTREDLLTRQNDVTTVWENYLTDLVKTADRYDLEIELAADYRDGSTLRPETVWAPIASIKHVTVANAAHVGYARKLVQRCNREDFQRRF